MTGGLDDLLGMVDALGLTLIEEEGEHLGGYRPDEGVIRIAPGLRRRAARSVLAHEIAHHVLGHLPTRDIRLRARQERAANEWAAMCLITPWGYRDAELIRDGHVASMAHDLDVTPEIVLACRDVLEREWTIRHAA